MNRLGGLGLVHSDVAMNRLGALGVVQSDCSRVAMNVLCCRHWEMVLCIATCLARKRANSGPRDSRVVTGKGFAHSDFYLKKLETKMYKI
jgi:hypothetical protein